MRHKRVLLSTDNVATLKKGQGHQNLITSFPHPDYVSVLVWSNSSLGNRDSARTNFLQGLFLESL